MLIIIYVSGTFDYLYIHESYVNLIWYLYVFLLNKLCLSLSLRPLNGSNRITGMLWTWCLCDPESSGTIRTLSAPGDSTGIIKQVCWN